jgi:UDP-N-acetylmuramyl pentapeptide synthase
MLQALKVTPGATRRIAMLGEMLELGDSAFALHEACGRAAAESASICSCLSAGRQQMASSPARRPPGLKTPSSFDSVTRPRPVVRSPL